MGTGEGDTPAGGDESIILVDEQDRPVGYDEKLRAHQNGGRLHRAFSVFIFDAAGRMLLQRRSVKKYHFGGLWTNACCSHPRKGQSVAEAARLRLRQEFGIDVPDLAEAFSFVYRAEDPSSGLTEHEFDHVLCGQFEGEPRPNSDEIDEWTWVDMDELAEDVRRHPERYTPWFKVALDRVMQHRRHGPARLPSGRRGEP
jgi:isopentenyl-diphosphate delta-isomerase